jgi:hypothetical protein
MNQKLVRVLDFNQILKALDQCVTSMGIHQIARALKLRTRQIGSILKYGADPLVVNRICPASVVDIGEREVHEHVANGCGIKDARIIECGKRHDQ